MLKLPVITFVSEEHGKGQLFINDMQIPGLAGVKFEMDVHKSIATIKLLAGEIQIKTPAEATITAEKQEPVKCEHNSTYRPTPKDNYKCADCGAELNPLANENANAKPV